MIVITRNGSTTVVTGWRAWLIGAAAFLATTVIFALIAFLFLGIAITVTTVLLIVVPVVIGVAILASLFQSRGRRSGDR